jgi:hypothetical protein
MCVDAESGFAQWGSEEHSNLDRKTKLVSFTHDSNHENSVTNAISNIKCEEKKERLPLSLVRNVGRDEGAVFEGKLSNREEVAHVWSSFVTDGKSVSPNR